MKLKLITLLAATFVSGLSHADCTQSSQAAEQFMNAYTKHSEDIVHKKTTETDSHWLLRNQQITDHFKKSYNELVAQAEKQDPELGLDFDPVFDGQDYPEQGYKIVSCEEQQRTNFVTLAGKGEGWENIRLVVKTINTQKGWLVDGAGVINIPKNKLPNP